MMKIRKIQVSALMQVLTFIYFHALQALQTQLNYGDEDSLQKFYLFQASNLSH
ncbi:hypothetical protein [Lactococcus allomyrinae]|uniref:hypothetical protein n=1 Tax=Lactococcus allomyrinae TaxID=2419773 RepID=UPI0013C49366|nr:hypothetical protein [Lactococcus allomyrinae]